MPSRKTGWSSTTSTRMTEIGHASARFRMDPNRHPDLDTGASAGVRDRERGTDPLGPFPHRPQADAADRWLGKADPVVVDGHDDGVVAPVQA